MRGRRNTDTLMLKTYNGFNHDQRMKGYRWLQREYAAGRRARPTVREEPALTPTTDVMTSGRKRRNVPIAEVAYRSAG
jgi:hypothetical protein